MDWHLLTLFCGLFIVIGALESTSLSAQAVTGLKNAGFDLGNHYVLAGVSLILSNLVSNVPAVMVLVNFLDPAVPESWYVLALSSTLAGNLLTIGSIANLITIEQARIYGVRISFAEHARAGIPITILTLGVTFLWIWLAA